MRRAYHVLAIIASVYCLYYQILFDIFNYLTLSGQKQYSGWFMGQTLSQILLLIICGIFLIINFRGLIKSTRRDKF